MKRMTLNSATLAAAAVVTLALSMAPAFAGPIGVIDTFSDASLAEYTQTLVLDQDATNGTAFASPAGSLQASKPSANTAEQNLFLRNDYSLGVGETLRVDTSLPATQAAYGEVGLAVGATPTGAVWTSGTVSTRANYVAVYANPNQDLVKSIGWDGTTQEPGTANLTIEAANVLGLYITKLTANDFSVGYTTGSGDVQQGTFSIGDTSAWSWVGFYSDIRGTVTVGTYDNLRIVPEPTSALLGLLGAMGLVALRKRIG